MEPALKFYRKWFADLAQNFSSGFVKLTLNNSSLIFCLTDDANKPMKF
jgi:hypothetical protein